MQQPAVRRSVDQFVDEISRPIGGVEEFEVAVGHDRHGSGVCGSTRNHYDARRTVSFHCLALLGACAVTRCCRLGLAPFGLALFGLASLGPCAVTALRRYAFIAQLEGRYHP